MTTDDPRMPDDRDLTDRDLTTLWDRFHQLVNMPSPQLRDALGTVGTGADLELGRRVLAVLHKRKVDCTGADVDTMREATRLIATRLAEAPRDALSDEAWRYSVEVLGHDPMAPDSPRGADAAILAG